MKKLLGVAFCLVAVFCSSCTEAKRFLDEKADGKATPSPRTNDPSIALKTSPSASQSPKAAPASSATFSGDIAGKAGKRLLYQLLEKNNQKPVKLDLLLSDEQLEQLNDVDKGKKWYFDLAYPGDDGYNTGGELLIDIAKGKGDLKLNGNRLTGNILVTNWTGPKQGLMSINAKPASSEPTSAKKEDPKPSPPAPAGGKPKQSAANNPPS
jgi:hypothetical protein